MEKKVVVNEKEYTVKEIPYLEAVAFGDSKTKRESAKLMMMACVGLTEEEVNKLTFKEGAELQKAIDEVNGVADFLPATVKKEPNWPEAT